MIMGGSNARLRAYVDELFINAPKTRKNVELKEEILQNLNDKYNDLLAEGKDEDAAYNIAVAGIGDIDSLIEEMKGPIEMYTKEEIAADRRRSALLMSVAVMLYILCPVPTIIINDNKIGPIALFLMVAAATGLIIYNNMTRIKYIKTDDTMLEDFKEWKNEGRQKKSLFGVISTSLWALTVTVYILVSFSTMAWHITWVIFLIATAINAIIKAVLDLTMGNGSGK